MQMLINLINLKQLLIYRISKNEIIQVIEIKK